MTDSGRRVTRADSADMYNRFRSYLERACGILLGDNKQFLVESRLNRILQSREIQDLNELVNILESSPYTDLKQTVVDAMTTNETMWFRDAHPYSWMRSHYFREVAKSLRKRSGEIRIWSAACSTGQEPYSISMVIEDAQRSGSLPSNLKVKIVATDISKGVLEIAQSGIYDQRALSRGLPDGYLTRYFRAKGAGCYEVKPDIKSRIEFKSINLKENFSLLGKFDLVLCRNVLIYFSGDLKMDVLRRLHSSICPGGYLFLGGSESLNGLPNLYEMIKYHPGIVYKTRAC